MFDKVSDRFLQHIDDIKLQKRKINRVTNASLCPIMLSICAFVHEQEAIWEKKEKEHCNYVAFGNGL